MITTGAMTKQLERLEKIDLVQKRPGPAPTRGYTVAVTDRGLELADLAMTALASDSFLSELRMSLPAEKRQALAQLCEELLSNFEQRQG